MEMLLPSLKTRPPPYDAMDHKRPRSEDADESVISSSPIKRPRRGSSPLTGTPYTPYPPEPLDSPSNPFGRKHARSRIHQLPPVTMFGKHFPLRFQFVRKGLGPRFGGVHRIVQVPLNYSFTHLRGLIAFLFDSHLRYNGRRGLSGPYGISDEYLFEVVDKVGMYSPLYKPGQIKSGTPCIKLSNVRDPCRWMVPTGYDSDEDDELDEDDEIHDPDAVHESTFTEDLEEKPGEWRWEDEEDFTLGHTWPKGLDVQRGIIYYHSRTTQIHITINSLVQLPQRTGKSNQPYVFVARGRMNLSPAPLPAPRFTPSPAKITPLSKRSPSVEADGNVLIENSDVDDEDECERDSSFVEDALVEIDPSKWNAPEGKFESYFFEFMGCPEVAENSPRKPDVDPFDDDNVVVQKAASPEESPYPKGLLCFGNIEADSDDEEQGDEGVACGEGEDDDEQDEGDGDDEQDEDEDQDEEDEEYSEDEEEWEDDVRSHPTSSPVRELSPSPKRTHTLSSPPSSAIQNSKLAYSTSGPSSPEPIPGPVCSSSSSKALYTPPSSPPPADEPSSPLYSRAAFSSPGPSRIDMLDNFVLSDHYPNPKYSETPAPPMKKAQRMRMNRLQRRISYSSEDGWKKIEEEEAKEAETLKKKKQKELERELALEQEQERERIEREAKEIEEAIQKGAEEEWRRLEAEEEAKILDERGKEMKKLWEVSKREFDRGVVVGKKVWKRRFERAGLEYPGWGVDDDSGSEESEEDQLADDDNEAQEDGDYSDAESVAV